MSLAPWVYWKLCLVLYLLLSAFSFISVLLSHTVWELVTGSRGKATSLRLSFVQDLVPQVLAAILFFHSPWDCQKLSCFLLSHHDICCLGVSNCLKGKSRAKYHLNASLWLGPTRSGFLHCPLMPSNNCGFFFFLLYILCSIYGFSWW